MLATIAMVVGLLAMPSDSLFVAARKADAERVAQLLAEGADPNSRSENRTTVLTLAAWLGHEAVVMALINAGADVNAQDDGGSTALLEAVSTRQIPVVSLLLKAGADPNIRTRDGRSPLGESRTRKRDFHIGPWMFVWGWKVGPNDELVRLLVEAGAER